MLQKILQHKFATLITIIILCVVGYFVYGSLKSNTSETRYVLVSVGKGTLIVSVSGSGQVATSNQIDIKSKAGGEIISFGIKSGQTVGAGALIAKIDSSEAKKNVRDAKINLETAKLNFEKFKKPADALTILQAENSLTQAKDSLTKLELSNKDSYQEALETKQKAQGDLNQAYEDGFNTTSSAFLSMPSIVTGLNGLLFDYGFSAHQSNVDWYFNQAISKQIKADAYRSDAKDAYAKAKKAYDDSFAGYKIASRNDDEAAIEALVINTYETARSIADAVKATDNYVDFVQGVMVESGISTPTLVATHQSSLTSYTGTTNTQLTNLLAIKNKIEDSKKAIENADRDIKAMDQNHPLEIAAQKQTIKEKEASLADLEAGIDKLDLKLQELSLKQKENALKDVQDKLKDYAVYAPFGGMIASVGVKKAETISSGATIATIIANQRIAEISLNEVDVSKVKVGQKATLTFDAIDGLTISGKVIEIDILGTVSQGVVTYNVKIGFDTQNNRIKPGMSVSAAVITETKQDVIIVPNAAIKSSGDNNYIEILSETVAPELIGDAKGVVSNTPPRQQQIGIGVANESETEVTNGLNEKDVIIIKTVVSTAAAAAASQQRSIFSFPGGGGGNRGGGIPR